MTNEVIEYGSSSRKKCKVCGGALRKGRDIGATCEAHLGLVGKYYVKMDREPSLDEYIFLKELCDQAEELGKSRYWMVKLTGGDAGVKPPFAPEFTIYEYGDRKYCRKDAIKSVRELAKG